MIWNPDCKGPCDCPGDEAKPVPTLGDIHKLLTGLTAQGVTLASIQWVMDNQMPVDPVPDCPDHKLVQHRDHKRPWCDSCGRDALGAVIGRPRIKRETIEEALENDRCGICGSVEHFREDHPRMWMARDSSGSFLPRDQQPFL